MGEAQTFVGGAAGFGTESGRVHGSNGCYITAYGGQKKELVAKLDILKPQLPPGVPAGGQGKDGLWALAAKGEKGVAAFIVNDSPKERQFAVDFGGRKPVSCRLTDGGHTDVEITEMPANHVLPPHSIILVNF